jgi:protein TonB
MTIINQYISRWAWVLLLLIPFFGAAQTEYQQDTTVVQFPDVDASFPGGVAAMQKWILTNICYPTKEFSIDELHESGKIWIEFIVETDGKLTHIKTIKPIHLEYQKMIDSLFETSPNWNPAVCGNKPCRSLYRLPIQICFSN